jgi:hypothetical protein
MTVYNFVIALDKQRNPKPKPLDYRSGRRNGVVVLARIPGVRYQVGNFLVYDFHICKIATKRPVVEGKITEMYFFFSHATHEIEKAACWAASVVSC